MKITTTFKSNCIYIIALLYILLFVYAAFSKLFDLQTFIVQLGQSPLLSAYASWIAFLIPSIEISIAFALMIARFRYIALLASFSLMIMFSVYITIILNYSSFIPCSCGGILSEMSWNEHLTFNLLFIAIALMAILLHKKAESTPAKQLIHITITTISSVLTVIILYLLSDGKNGLIDHHFPI